MPQQAPQGYTITKQIGEGGFGGVWAAEGPGGVPVALKMPTDFDDRQLERFRREVKVQSALTHTNVVEVLDFDLKAITPWVALPLAQSNLAEQIERSDATPESILRWLTEVLSGMAYAHVNHVLHRDLKPANVLIFESENSQREARVADFGLSRRFTRDPETFQTQTGEAFGTRWFTAPEQWSGFREVDVTADIYSLGRILEYCMARRREFRARYPALEHCVRVATSEDPTARYQDIEQLQSETALLATGSSELSRPLDRAISAVQAAAVAENDSGPIRDLVTLLASNADDYRILQRIFSRIPYEILDRILQGHSGQFRVVISSYVHSLESPLPVDAAVRASNLLDHCLDATEDGPMRAEALFGLLMLAARYEMQPFSSIALHRMYTERNAGVLTDISTRLRTSPAVLAWARSSMDSRLLPDVVWKVIRNG